MKRLSFLLPALALALVLGGFAGTRPHAAAKWNVDKGHSNIGFKVRHLGITNVNGKFKTYDVTLSLDPTDLQTLQASAEIDVQSIDTGIERRDNHLRSDDFFAAEQHPKMTFVSTGVEAVDGATFRLRGDLTIRGTTKPVVLEAELLGPIAGPGGKERIGFTATTRIDRMEYGLKWDNVTEAGGLVVAREVDIILELEAIREAPAN